MDMSKLPRMSNTPPEPHVADEASSPPPVPRAARSVGGAESWLSIGLGVILIFMNWRIVQWYVARSRFTWTFSDAQGKPLTYPQTVFYWGDLALFSFALVLIAEGLILGFLPRRGPILFSFALTACATLLNLGYLVYVMTHGYDFQIFSALATVFGVYMMSYQLKLARLA